MPYSNFKINVKPNATSIKTGKYHGYYDATHDLGYFMYMTHSDGYAEGYKAGYILGKLGLPLSE